MAEATSKTLVAYFSASGVTRALATRMADAIGADVFEIAPAQPYTAADLDWTNENSRSTVEMKNPASRPAIAGMPDNLAGYDTVLIGFPIWWYTAPTIVKTFLEAGDFSGKRIALFATSNNTMVMGRTQSDLEPCAPRAIWVGDGGRRFSADAGADELAAWVNGLA